MRCHPHFHQVLQGGGGSGSANEEEIPPSTPTGEAGLAGNYIVPAAIRATYKISILRQVQGVVFPTFKKKEKEQCPFS